MWQSWHWTPSARKALFFHSLKVAFTTTPLWFTASWQVAQNSLFVCRAE